MRCEMMEFTEIVFIPVNNIKILRTNLPQISLPPFELPIRNASAAAIAKH